MYQLTILVKDKLDEKGRTGLIDDVKKSFGSLVKEDLWGVRSLAYEIKHADKAFYAYFEFEADGAAVVNLDKNLRLNEDIVRYLIVKKKVSKVGKVSKVSKGKTEEAVEKLESKESEEPNESKSEKVEEKVEKKAKAKKS